MTEGRPTDQPSNRAKSALNVREREREREVAVKIERLTRWLKIAT
jgi:hypothetical protein